MSARPRCNKPYCARPGPTINGRCADHLSHDTLAWLTCVSPEELSEHEQHQ